MSRSNSGLEKEERRGKAWDDTRSVTRDEVATRTDRERPGVSQSQQIKDDRPIGLKRAVPYLRVGALVVVTLVVVTALRAAATRNSALAWLVYGVLAIYFPPPLVTGSPTPELIGVAIFLVVAAFLLSRRRYWSALASLVLPIAFTWVFAFKLMGG
jgi:hypothetical protein